MANVRISDLTLATTVANTDELEINNGGTSKKANPSQIVYAATGAGPLVSAYVNTSITNVTGAATNYDVIFDTEVFDVASNYNTASGVFTAPATGKYLFCGALTMDEVASTANDVRLTIITSNRAYGSLITPNLTVISSVHLPFSVIADMDSADTANIRIQISGMGGDTADVLGVTASTIRSWWSIMRVA